MKKYQILVLICIMTSALYAQSPCTSPSISGKLTYDNFLNTPLNASKVYLRTLTGVIIDSSITNQNGNYRFCNIPYGNYKLTAKTNYPWDGVNSVDALTALHHFTGIITLTGIRFKAGDVNASSYINASDAYNLTNRFVQISSMFPIGDWVFEESQVVVSDTTPQYIDIKGLCTGDLDGSNIPFLQSFVTCGDTLIDQRDNQKYPTVLIGTQCWMKRNLNVGVMVTNTFTELEHSDCSNNGIIEKYCYNNDPAICATYGGLYDWNEMMQYNTSPGIQGICPLGWHIPTDAEWCIMTTYIDPTVNCSATTWTGTSAGSKLKEIGTTHWAVPNTGATNQSGFTALGTGNRSRNGGFLQYNVSTAFWSSTEIISVDGVIWGGVIYNHTDIARFHNTNVLGMTVRCVKD